MNSTTPMRAATMAMINKVLLLDESLLLLVSTAVAVDRRSGQEQDHLDRAADTRAQHHRGCRRATGTSCLWR